MGRRAAHLLAAVSVVALTGCGSITAARKPAGARADLTTYLGAIEPVRLAVNQLLERADPILRGARKHRISPAVTARRMGALEQRFADYAVDIAAIEPSGSELRALHAAYAHTYVLEDAYLSALTVGLAERNFDHLPDTQAAQRAAIIRWRIGLMVLAARTGVALPADLQQAGRGEIAPSPGGS